MARTASLSQVCYHLPVTLAHRFTLLAFLLLVIVPAPASAQVFIASVPDPAFAIGPLTIRATVMPSLSPVDLEVRWSLDVDAGKSRVGLEQDLYLLWPGEVMSPLGDAKSDKTLEKYVEARGFAVVGGGRLLSMPRTSTRRVWRRRPRRWARRPSSPSSRTATPSD